MVRPESIVAVSEPLEGQKHQALGLLLLKDLVTAAFLVHTLNVVTIVIEGTWNGFAAWELVSGAVAGGLLGVWARVEQGAKARIFYTLVALTLTRWSASWLLGSPDVVYTSVVSGLAYAPFLIPIAMLFGVKRITLVAVSSAIAVTGLAGVMRMDLATTALSEWRIAPAVFVAVVLMGEYARRWSKHLDELQESQNQAQSLTLELQSATSRHLSSRMDSITEVGGALAHELNNLLAVVQPLSAHLMASLEGDLQADARDIYRSSERATALGRQLLMLTQSHGQVEQPCDLAEILWETFRSMRAAGRWPETVAVDCPPGPVPVGLRSEELIALLTALVQNSLDASSPGGSVGVSLEKGLAVDIASGELIHGEVVLQVDDRGHGIDGALLGTVMEPFVTTRSEPGRGLGLTTVLAVVQRAGGRLELLPREGGGTRACVRLPLWQLESSARPLESSQPDPAEAIPEPRGPLRVVLVDDEPMVLRATGRILTRAGLAVTSFERPLDALAYLIESAAEVDVVVSDVRMPMMSGPELADAVQAELDHPPPFLFITGHIDTATALRSQLSADRVLHKPFRGDALLARMEALTRKEGATAGIVPVVAPSGD